MIKCPVCGMEFNTKEEHDKHHTETHGHALKCQACGYAAKSNDDLEIHNKTHEKTQV